MTSLSIPLAPELPCQSDYMCAGCHEPHAVHADCVAHEDRIYCLNSFAKVIRGYQRARSTFKRLEYEQEASVEAVYIKPKKRSTQAERRIVLISYRK